MKKKLLFATLFALTTFFGTAQNTQSQNKGIIKIVTVDENGNKKEVVKHFDSLDKDDLKDLEIQLQEIEGLSNALQGVSVFSLDGENIEVNLEQDGDAIVIQKSRHTDRPFLGIHMESHESGVLISKVVKGSAAEKAGLRAGDVISAVNGKQTASGLDLGNILGELAIGEIIEISYLRNGSLETINAELGVYPKSEFEEKVFWTRDGNDFDIDYKELEQKPFLGITPVKDPQGINGVMIYKVIEGTSAEELGLQTGDVIYEINGQQITTFEELAGFLKIMKPEDQLTVKYKRDGKKKSVSGQLGSRADAHSSFEYEIKEMKDCHFDDLKFQYGTFIINDDKIEELSKASGIDLNAKDRGLNGEVNIFPNPTSDRVTVSFETNALDPLSIMLYDSNGKEIFNENIKEFRGELTKEIDLSNYDSGVYYLIISQNDKFLTEKIVLN